MRFLTLLSVTLLSVMATAISANAATDSIGVVAIVGETPITNLDLSDRTELILRSSGMSSSPEIRKKVASQALKQLVDEQLQAMEAKKRGMSVSNAELGEAISGLEQQNQQAAGSLKNFMLAKGVSWEAFLSQLRAQLLWNKMLFSTIRSKVRISEAEYERAAQNQRLVESGVEYNITPLVLTVDSPEKEQPLMELANQVVAQVQEGASLESVMQQLMQVPAGSEPRFWVTAGQIEPALSSALELAQVGEVVGPIRSPRGIHIMRVNETRKKTNVTVIDPSQVIMKEILLGLDTNASSQEVNVTMQLASQIAANPGTCLEPTVAGMDQFVDTNIEISFLQSTMSNLPAYAQQQAQSLSVGQVGEPFATPDGIRLYILCEKVNMPVQTTADEALRERLFREKLELESAKFMRALRRSSFIEVRV